MAHYKTCSECCKTKKVEEFSKRSASKDGLQGRCKSCNKIYNKDFRTENPEHHAIWQRVNRKRANEILKKYRKADKGSIIYYIKSPEGMYYIGMTEAYISVRELEHRLHYRLVLQGKREPLPLLHASFDKWGFENHKSGILFEFENISRRELYDYESIVIAAFQELGISLNAKK